MKKSNLFLIKGVIIVILLVVIFTQCSKDDGLPEQKIIAVDPTEEQIVDEEQEVIEEAIEVNEETRVKAYFVEEFHPGVCFDEVCDVDVEGILSDSAELIGYLQERFNTLDGDALARLAQQYNQIKLTPYDHGYYFTIQDGQGCSVTKYTGRISTVDVAEEDWLPAHVDKSTDLLPCYEEEFKEDFI